MWFGFWPWSEEQDGQSTLFFRASVHGVPFEINNNFNIKPGYIESFKVLENGQAFQFRLDTSKKFHDGKNFTARDFEYSMIRALISPQTRPEREFMSLIAGARRLQPGDKFKFHSFAINRLRS